MESKELTVQEKAALQLKERSTGLIAILTDNEKSKDFERGLTIQKIIDSSIPMSVIQKSVGYKAIAQALDIQLTRLVANLNLKWSLSDFQIAQIVEDLLEKYPNETLEDFVLIFKQARQGKFGELFRLDSAVVFTWVNKYLEEKYFVIENNLVNEKDNNYQQVVKELKDWPKEWRDKILGDDIGKNAAPLSQEEIELEGQEKPLKKVHLTDQAYLNDHRRRIHQYQELTVRERHPEWTDEQVKERLEELKKEARYTTDAEKIIGKPR